MVFADLKNDYVFWRIFAKHPDLLCALLNDLLERTDERAIEAIEYLPIGQAPRLAGAKLSILDVRCRDRTGMPFVVEIQLFHVNGFGNHMVYDACKAPAGQREEGDELTKLTDVVAITICNFELWPDAQQRAQNRPLVPMLSRWNATERASGNHGLLQVQYVFLELPKLPTRRPDTPGATLWAWLFAHAPELTEVPANFSRPYRAALELANKSTFTQLQLDAYRRVIDEIQQAEELVEVKLAEGKARSEAKGKANAILTFLSARSIAVSAEARARIEACKDLPTLDRWIGRAAVVVSAEDIFA